jgi:hypothetical protein
MTDLHFKAKQKKTSLRHAKKTRYDRFLKENPAGTTLRDFPLQVIILHAAWFCFEITPL